VLTTPGRSEARTDSVARVLPPQPVRSFEDYVDQGGGAGLRAALGSDPLDVIGEVEASGLRGRGGAGFPTGRKWRNVCIYESGAHMAPTVVINGAEGEPGSFKDREILRRSPYQVLEGALIAAHAVGAVTLVFGLRASATVERERLEAAIDEVRAARWLDGIGVDVFSGPEEYLVGEETALLEVLAGRDPFPRIAPPYRRGFDEIIDEAGDSDSKSASASGVELAGVTDDAVAPPTLVNNVETIANVAKILSEGADWFRSLGTEASPGTAVCTVTGATGHHGVGEIELGTPLRVVVEKIGGGPRPGRTLRAVMSGVSNRLVTEAQLDTPVTYEALQEIGSGLGCGAFVVFDDQTDFAAVAAGVARFLSVESCGQCTPCKRDGLAIAELFDGVRRSEADTRTLPDIGDHLRTVADSARCNLASQYQQVLGSIVEHFGDELRAHVDGQAEAGEPYLVAPIQGITDGRAVLEAHHTQKQPDWTYDAVWSGQSPVERGSEHRAPEAV
jgi:NADH-quinone oxidoreductase subunit F